MDVIFPGEQLSRNSPEAETWRGQRDCPGPPSYVKYTNAFPTSSAVWKHPSFGIWSRVPSPQSHHPALHIWQPIKTGIYSRRLLASKISHTGPESHVRWVPLGENGAVSHHVSMLVSIKKWEVAWLPCCCQKCTNCVTVNEKEWLLNTYDPVHFLNILSGHTLLSPPEDIKSLPKQS